MAQATHAVVSMSPERCAEWGLTPIGFPVRARMVDRILGGQSVDLEALLEESDRYLGEHLELRWLHQDNMSLLAYFAAKAAAEAGDHQAVAHLAEIGLKYRPSHHGHHAHLGLARQCLGDLEGAVEAYRFILDDLRADADGLVRGFCAQALLDLGRPFEALLLCWPAPIGLEFDESWFRLVARLCDACELPYPSRPSPVVEQRRLREVLSSVPGIDEPLQQAIATRFRTLRALAVATVVSIEQTPGMNRDLATRVFARLHPDLIIDTSRRTAQAAGSTITKPPE